MRLAVGATVLLAVLGLVTTAIAPGASYVFAWPALFGAVALARPSSAPFRYAILAAPAVVILVPDVVFCADTLASVLAAPFAAIWMRSS